MSDRTTPDAKVERHLRAIFDEAYEFLGLLSTGGTLLEVNQAALEYVGASRQGVLGLPYWETPWWTALTADDRARLHTALANAVRGAFVRYEIDLRSAAGEIHSFDFSLKPVTDEAGRVTFVIAEGRDITDRRRAEEELRIAEARAGGVISIAADAIISIDDGQRITLFNKGAERTFGYVADEVLGQPLDLLIPERFRALHRRHIAHFADSAVTARRMGERQEIFGLRKDGTEFPAEASISKLDIGGRRIVTAVLRDVSERKEAEQEKSRLLARATAARAAAEAAERREAFLAEVNAALDSTLDYELGLRSLAQLVVPAVASYCIVDSVGDDGAVRRVHVEAADPAKAALANRLYLFPPDPVRPSLVRTALVSGRSALVADLTDEVLREVTRDEDHFAALRALSPRSCIVVPLTARGRTLGTIALIADETRRRYGQVDLAFAEELAGRAALSLDNARLYQTAQRATRLRDEVLGVVSHDLRNPVTAISMCARGLEGLVEPSNAQAGGMVRTIQESVDLMQRMIQDLLDVTSIDAGRLSVERQLEDPMMLLMQAVEQHSAIATSHGIDLVVEVPESLPAIWVDGDRLLQVLANLLGNAVKFTAHGGRITVRAAATIHDVTITVADTGCGIATADLPQIFDQFWQSRRSGRTRGTGLGLAIAKGIVEAHGGRIWAESRVGAGTTVHLTLPTQQKAISPPAMRGAAATDSLRPADSPPSAPPG